MLLELSRPLAVIDVQSTGLDTRTARIVRMSVLKVSPDGDRRSRSVLVNPGVPIPPGASAVHGITDDDVIDEPPFAAYARGLAEYLDDCDLAGFGIERFGLPLLKAEFRRAGVEFSEDDRAVIDTMTIFHRKEPRDFRAAHTRFAGGELPEKGSAEELLDASLAVLEGELAAYDDLPRDMRGLRAWLHPLPEDSIDSGGRFVWSADGEAVFNFGRHRTRPLVDVVMETPDYLEWIATSSDFPEDVRHIAREAMAGEYPQRDE